MDASIQEVVRLTGTTSRTLRHYDDIGLLRPSRVGANGLRYYDQVALTRLQRILMLRDLGLGTSAIAQVLAGHTDDATALATHLDWLRAEQGRIDRQIVSIQRTIDRRKGDGELMAKDMFDGFDHTQYQEEVEQRWGSQAWADGDRWWRGLDDEQRRTFGQRHLDIAADYASAREAGLDVTSDEVQDIVRRHYEWISIGWQGRRPTAEQFMALGEMYVADERFAQNYGGVDGAGHVRDAMIAYAADNLG